MQAPGARAAQPCMLTHVLEKYLMRAGAQPGWEQQSGGWTPQTPQTPGEAWGGGAYAFAAHPARQLSLPLAPSVEWVHAPSGTSRACMTQIGQRVRNICPSSIHGLASARPLIRSQSYLAAADMAGALVYGLVAAKGARRCVLTCAAKDAA